jgi:hypothetical protein
MFLDRLTLLDLVALKALRACLHLVGIVQDLAHVEALLQVEQIASIPHSKSIGASGDG